jgi:predicted RNA methylase
VSRALAKDKRNPGDYYSTPAWAVRALLRVLPAPTTVLEPAAGTGAILTEIKRMWPATAARGIEIDPGRAEQCREIGHDVVTDDFLLAPIRPADMVITNPPFSLALEFVQRGLATAPHVAMLLRLSFLASIKRAAFIREHSPDVFILSKRPSFSGGATDSTDYAWMYFGPLSGKRWTLLDCEDR